MAFSPDGTTFASGSEDRVYLWDAFTGEHKQTLTGVSRTVTGKPGTVGGFVFSPDGTVLTGSGGGWDNHTVELWDMVQGEHKGTLECYTYDFILAFSPDGRTLACGESILGYVELWDTVTGQPKQLLSRRGIADITSLAFSPDGAILASGSDDNIVRLWNAVTGEYKQRLAGPTGRVYHLAFSPDGGTLASGSADGIVRLWHAVTGERKEMLTGHTNSCIQPRWRDACQRE